jgi:hypothetical protein
MTGDGENVHITTLTSNLLRERERLLLLFSAFISLYHALHLPDHPLSIHFTRS